MFRRLSACRDGRQVPSRRDLALNLSFVLHEPSTNPAVIAASRACQAHSRRQFHAISDLVSPVSCDAVDMGSIEMWLTASIGLPSLLTQSLNVVPDRLVSVDQPSMNLIEHDFFRAPARLKLPDDASAHVGVAALLLRPGRTSSHLALNGPYDWPTQRSEALRAVERLIQAYASQWMPPRQLWSAPAENLLADEVY